MSSHTNQATDADRFRELLKQYRPGTGEDRYARFASDVLGVTRTHVLDRLSAALVNHRQVIAVGGNSVGKSYAAAALGVAALYCNPHTTVPITAGNGDTVKNSIWKPIKGLFNDAPLPGDYNDSSRELKTPADPNWYLECHSPQYPEDLEGDHNETVIYLIEEAEKPGVTEEHIDSARSTLSSDNDRLLVLANPPTDETNVVSRLIDKPEWHTLHLPSWESHNIRQARGIQDHGEEIRGLATVDKLRRDWQEYHEEPWPGLEEAIRVSSPYLDAEANPVVSEADSTRENPDFRDDLHDRWYKRRVGIIPPEGSDTWRPWSLADVEHAWNRGVGRVRETPEAIGIDVARQVDSTVMIGLHGPKAVVEYESQAPHNTQRTEITDLVREWPKVPVTVDAVGKGEPLADELDARFPDVRHFGNNQEAVSDAYRTKWGHGLQLIGQWLRGGGTFDHTSLYEELRVAASVLEFRENHLRSRGTVIEATKKERVKEELGRSPDYLDALLESLYSRETDSTDEKASPTFGW